MSHADVEKPREEKSNDASNNICIPIGKIVQRSSNPPVKNRESKQRRLGESLTVANLVDRQRFRLHQLPLLVKRLLCRAETEPVKS